MKTQPRENERRDSVIIIVLILLLGFICIIITSGWALRFAPSWKLNTNMGSNLDPNSDFLTSRPISFIEPLDPAILTNPAWMDVFLTPGASSSFPTRTPLPASTATLVPVKTSTPLTTTVTATTVVNPTNTLIYFPPTITATPRPPSTNTPITPVTPLPSADLQIFKTDGMTTYNPGGTLIYSVIVQNNGASAVTGAVVTDNKPAQVISWSWACTSQTGGATGCNAVAGSTANFTDSVNLPNGASIVYTVTANISAAATGNLVNTATIASGVTDSILGNNTATDTDAPSFTADLGITKTDGVTTYTPGGAPLTYTITVINNGPAAVTGAIVTDNKPAQITTWDWACTSQTGGANGCTPVTGSVSDFADGVNLPIGASVVYTVTANISPVATGNLVNRVDVAVPTGYTDPTPGNDFAIDSDTANAQTDLTITKDDGSLTYTAGNPITYTIVVSNAGPSNATGVSVADTIPAAITVTTINCVASGTASCGTNVSAGNNLSYTGVNISAGAGNFLTITVSGTIAPATTGDLANTATVTAGAGQTDLTPVNNSASDTDTQFVPPSADLQITKTDGVTTYTPGGAPLNYTIIVTNNGPDAVTGATVTDNFPAQIISANWTCATTGSATCGAPGGSGNINDLVNLPVGSTVTYTVTANTSANAVGTLANTATVAVPVGATETNAANNTATDSDTSISTDPNIGPRDGSYISPGPNSTVTILFSPPIVANGDGTYDFVYYERIANPLDLPANWQIALDWVQIEISADGVTWYQVLYWGDPGGVPDTNTNVDLGIVGDICEVATIPTEIDNCGIPVARLYNLTGIQIDVDGIVPLGNYPWMRITSPPGGVNGTDIDAIEIILP